MTTTKKRIGRPTTTDPRVHRYNFKLTTEENIRFKQMLCKAGLEHNRSRFIVKRIFGEEFVVVKRDPSKVQFIARLNDFYFQFQKLGNNYNQIVHIIVNIVANYFLGQKNGGKFSPPAAFPFLPIFSSFDFYK